MTILPYTLRPNCVIICVLMFSKNHEWAGYSRADTRTSTTTGAIIWIELD